jgi:putative FmdB family regulatory protein
MPIFEFTCNKCGKSFEKILFKPLENASIVCPECGSSDIQKLISAPGSVGVKGGSNDSHSCSGGCCAPAKSKYT